MELLTRHIIAVPVTLFLIMVLGAPMLTIHHVHRIETLEPVEQHRSATGQAVADVPSTYQEFHVVSLLPGDSFNSSSRNDVAQSLHRFVATLPLEPLFSGTHWRSHRAFAHIRPLFRLSGDTCALFCSFLI